MKLRIQDCDLGDVVYVYTNYDGYIVEQVQHSSIRATVIGIDKRNARILLGWTDEDKPQCSWRLEAGSTRDVELIEDHSEYAYAYYLPSNHAIKHREDMKPKVVYHPPPSGAPKHINASDIMINDMIVYAMKSAGSLFHMTVIALEEDEDASGEACVRVRGKIYGENMNKSEVKLKQSSVVLLIKREV